MHYAYSYAVPIGLIYASLVTESLMSATFVKYLKILNIILCIAISIVLPDLSFLTDSIGPLPGP